MTLLDALDQLSEKYFADNWYAKHVFGIGIGENCLEAYVKSGTDSSFLPNTFAGWPVLVLYCEDLMPLMLPQDAANSFVEKHKHKTWFQRNVSFVTYDQNEIVVYLTAKIPDELPGIYNGRKVRPMTPSSVK